MLYRQGDVLIERVTNVRLNRRKKIKRVGRDRGRIVLAYGEATGHAHAVLDREAELYETDLGERFLWVLAEGGVTVTHEEHAAITLPPGTYRIGIQREYEPRGARNVAD